MLLESSCELVQLLFPFPVVSPPVVPVLLVSSHDRDHDLLKLSPPDPVLLVFSHDQDLVYV